MVMHVLASIALLVLTQLLLGTPAKCNPQCDLASANRTFTTSRGQLYYEFWKGPFRSLTLAVTSEVQSRYEFGLDCAVQVRGISYITTSGCSVRSAWRTAYSYYSPWGTFSPVSLVERKTSTHTEATLNVHSRKRFQVSIYFKQTSGRSCQLARFTDSLTLTKLQATDTNECFSASACSTGQGRRQCCGKSGPCAACGVFPDSSSTHCVNLFGSYQCSCVPGYAENAATHRCEDVNECGIAGGFNCHAHSSCKNTAGSYACSCDSGYTETARSTCTDNDECASGTHNCDSNAACTNIAGS
eukprot:scpid94720/ scgid11449/ EGF-like module-containing mucin-like hormone receptor-like 2; EGF-like module receptor 2